MTLWVELNPNHQKQNICILGKYWVVSRMLGVALEHKAALIGMAVQPPAKSATQSVNINSDVRSSRSAGYRAKTAMTSEFVMIFTTITVLMIAGFTSLNSYASMTKRSMFFKVSKLC